MEKDIPLNIKIPVFYTIWERQGEDRIHIDEEPMREEFETELSEIMSKYNNKKA